ncbi:type II CAAX endopeptidase family protein [Nocardia sp. NPDC051990]|uniref:CPBP family intramembrane glutamic endopeptidase n=1 Tax=Nocardia sp. NPDC051990 TaxID=3155285 RepID=UPI00342E261F
MSRSEGWDAASTAGERYVAQGLGGSDDAPTVAIAGQTTAAGSSPRRHGGKTMGSLILTGGVAVFFVAVVGLLLTGHDSIMPSTDSDEQLSLAGALLPVAAGLLLVRLVPPRATGLAPEVVGDRAGLIRETAVVASVAVLMPLILFVLVAAGTSRDIVQGVWALGKPVFFLLLPWFAFRAFRAARDISKPHRVQHWWWPRQWWRWLAPIPALLIFGYLSLVGPFSGALPNSADYPDPVVLVIGATVTVFTANICEEVFYRVMLQTRLEALFGRWPGIVLGALLFALLHLPTHGQSSAALTGLPLTLGAIVAFQGTYAVFAGYLWARYRNVWVLVAAHSIVNTFPLLLM